MITLKKIKSVVLILSTEKYCKINLTIKSPYQMNSLYFTLNISHLKKVTSLATIKNSYQKLLFACLMKIVHKYMSH